MTGSAEPVSHGMAEFSCSSAMGMMSSEDCVAFALNPSKEVSIVLVRGEVKTTSGPLEDVSRWG